MLISFKINIVLYISLLLYDVCIQEGNMENVLHQVYMFNLFWQYKANLILETSCLCNIAIFSNNNINESLYLKKSLPQRGFMVYNKHSLLDQ